MNVIQSIHFRKDKFTESKARDWLKKRGFKSGKVDKSANFLKFRQLDPKGFNKFITEKLSKDINVIYAGKQDMAKLRAMRKINKPKKKSVKPPKNRQKRTNSIKNNKKNNKKTTNISYFP